MRNRVAINLVLAAVWLGLGVFIFINYPPLRDPLGEDWRALAFWLVFTGMFLWRLVSAYLSWRMARKPASGDDTIV